MIDMAEFAAADRESREDVTGWLLALDEEAFRHYVASDVRRELDAEASAALRDPRVITRWRTALTALFTSIETQFAETKGDRSPEADAWRRKAARFRDAVRSRRLEAKALRVSQGDSSWDAAVRRLIQAHGAEFGRILVEERRNAAQDGKS